jgi:hypothetical protein
MEIMKVEQKERITKWVKSNDIINHELMKSYVKFVIQALITKDPAIEAISEACKNFDESAMRAAIQIQSAIMYKLKNSDSSGVAHAIDLIHSMNNEDALMEFIDELKQDEAIGSIVNDYIDNHQ